MKLLLSLDTHDYNPEGIVLYRPCARAIIVRDADMFVQDNDYFLFATTFREEPKS